MPARPRSVIRMEAERLFAVGLIVLVLAVFLLVKPDTVASTWIEQQAQTARWIGVGANTTAFDAVREIIYAMYARMQSVIDPLQDISVNRWMAERLYVLVAWVSIVLYRGATLAYMSMYFVPILAAAALDGLFVREIRKTSFVSQSPFLHKIGSRTIKLVAALALVWLFLPWGVPAAAMPAAGVFISAAVWAWAANLQKRV